MKIKELIQITEAAAPTSVKGHLAMFDPKGNTEHIQSVYAFKDSAAAEKFLKGAEAEVDSDAYANGEYHVDGYDLIFICDHKCDLDEISMVAFNTSEAECRAAAQDMVDSQGDDDTTIDDIVFIETD